MSIAMRMKISDLSVDNARGRGGFGAGVYWGVGVQQIIKRPPINYFPLMFYSISLIFHLFHFFPLTRLTYITTP